MGVVWDLYVTCMGAVWDLYGTFMGLVCDLYVTFPGLRCDLDGTWVGLVWVCRLYISDASAEAVFLRLGCFHVFHTNTHYLIAVLHSHRPSI